MKKYLVLFLLAFTTSTICVAQTYTEKYNSLYNRYEYFDSQGNLIGYKKWNSLYERWEYHEEKPQQSQRNYGEYVQPYDMDLIYKALELKQRQYDQAIERARQQRLATAELERNKAVNRMNQIIDYYNSAKSYPSQIPNGWHNVFSMNKYDFCEQRKVYVYDNKITKYVVDDWSYRTVSYSLPISNAKTTIKIQESPDDLLSIFFLESIYNPTSTTSPPIQPGEVSFWTNDPKGNTEIYVEGIYIGTLTSYFKEGSPNCGQSGTVVYKNKPGTYNYVAKSSSGTWKGTITISGTGCSKMKLNK